MSDCPMRLKPLALAGNGILLGALAVFALAGDDLDLFYMVLMVPVVLNIVLFALWL